MAQRWLDFRDNFCYYSNFNDLKDKQHEISSADYSASMNREHLNEVTEIICEDLQFNIEIGNVVLQNQKEYNSLKNKRQKLNEEAEAAKNLAKKERLTVIIDEISRINAETRRLKEDFIQNKTIIESNDMAICELELYLSSWNSLLVINPPFLAPDEIQQVDEDLNEIEMSYKVLLELYEEYAKTCMDWNRTSKNLETKLNEITTLESKITFLNIKQENEGLATEFMTEMKNIWEQQVVTTTEIKANVDTYEKKQQKFLKKAKDKMEKIINHRESDERSGLELIDKIITFQNELRLVAFYDLLSILLDGCVILLHVCFMVD